MQNKSEQGIKVIIMGKQHHIVCPSGQEHALEKAATHLNILFEKMKNKSGIRNSEKALLMAALNLSHELLELQQSCDVTEQKLSLINTKLLKNLD